VLNIVSGVFAGLAALFWFLSVLPRTPDKLPTPYGGKTSAEAQALLRALRLQSRFNAIGSVFAAMAAVLQIAAGFLR
jgi:hypothetical protein